MNSLFSGIAGAIHLDTLYSGSVRNFRQMRATDADLPLRERGASHSWRWLRRHFEELRVCLAFGCGGAGYSLDPVAVDVHDAVREVRLHRRHRARALQGTQVLIVRLEVDATALPHSHGLDHLQQRHRLKHSHGLYHLKHSTQTQTQPQTLSFTDSDTATNSIICKHNIFSSAQRSTQSLGSNTGNIFPHTEE